jgi:Sulfotransferase family
MTTPVLVTGSNRSGTTWVGEMLCGSGELAYVHEAFNATNWPQLLNADLAGHYVYVCEENEAPYLAALQQLLELRMPLSRNLRTFSRPLDPIRLARETLKMMQSRQHHVPVLLKDPIAFFSTEWLVDRFEFRPVILVRHPAGFASSLIRLGWAYDFNAMASQPLLLEHLLSDYAADIHRFAAEPQPLIDQAVLLWRIFTHTAARWAAEHPDWHVLRYEDIADDPAQQFQRLYEDLGLSWTETARQLVSDYSTASDPGSSQPSGKGGTKRDSAATRKIWTTRLNEVQLAKIRTGVSAEYQSFYHDDEWLIE